MKKTIKLIGITAFVAVIRHGRRCDQALAGVFAKRKLLSIITAGMLLLCLAACGGDDGNGGDNNTGGDYVWTADNTFSSFTLTGIPSQHNGKYVYLTGLTSEHGSVFYGYQKYMETGNSAASTAEVTLCPISNGSVSLPMTICTSYRNHAKYTGNDTLYSVTVYIHNSQTITTNSGEVGGATFYNVTFSNGNASKTWNDKAP